MSVQGGMDRERGVELPAGAIEALRGSVLGEVLAPAIRATTTAGPSGTR